MLKRTSFSPLLGNHQKTRHMAAPVGCGAGKQQAINLRARGDWQVPPLPRLWQLQARPEQLGMRCRQGLIGTAQTNFRIQLVAQQRCQADGARQPFAVALQPVRCQARVQLLANGLAEAADTAAEIGR